MRLVAFLVLSALVHGAILLCPLMDGAGGAGSPAAPGHAGTSVAVRFTQAPAKASPAAKTAPAKPKTTPAEPARAPRTQSAPPPTQHRPAMPPAPDAPTPAPTKQAQDTAPAEAAPPTAPLAAPPAPQPHTAQPRQDVPTPQEPDAPASTPDGHAQADDATPTSGHSAAGPAVVKDAAFGSALGPDYASFARPIYPARALRRHKEGTVLVRLRIDKTGAPQEVRILRSAGRDLDAAAKDAVLSSTFRPLMRGGVPQPCWTEIPITFRLR